MADGEKPKKKSDLGVRTASAIVMLALAGTALALGGWFWIVFVAFIALGVMHEWKSLVVKFAKTRKSLASWLVTGAIYTGIAGLALVYWRAEQAGYWLVMLILAVIGTDVGAYFFGRAIGGPKIAPALSPSKTWAGLLGGIVGAFVLTLLLETVTTSWIFARQGGDWREWAIMTLQGNWGWALLLGCIVAPLAQAGDFFESWMKRRAGVKDSGRLIPGHGGVFDRVDGLLAVSFMAGIYTIFEIAMFA